MSDSDDPVKELRARAEARLRRSLDAALHGGEDHAHVVHELEVHEAELEIQNEELRRTSNELAETRDRYLALFDGAPVGFVTIDREGLVRAANRVAGRLLGEEPAVLVGRSLASRFAGDEIAKLRRYLLAVLASDPADTPELELTRVDREGRTLRLHLQGSVHGSPDAPEGWLALSDVTTQRETEAQLAGERDFAERLFDIAPVFALVLDLEGRIVRFNRYLEEVSGYTIDEVRGADWFTTFLPERARSATREAFDRATSGGPTRGNVSPMQTRSGAERLVDWYDTPILGSDGSPSGILAFGRDITEATRLEQEARHAQKMEAVGTLAAGVAHDFNNLLMGIAGVLELAIRKTPEGSEVRPLLEMILERAKAGTATVSQLMAFSRRAPLEPVEQSFDASVEEVAGMLEVMLGEDVALDVSLEAPGARVRIGRGQIEQIITNLCLNARQAMPRGGRLSIRSSVDTRGHGPTLCLEVEDTGSGMDESVRRRAFEPFFTTKQEGTGLGLSTVYGIVQGVGGSVDVESAKGAGTRFRIHLPRVRESQVGLLAQPVVPRRGEGETILLVEDEDVVRLTVRQYLEDGGYRVLEAEDAAAALDLCREHAAEIDLLLSDVVLPGVQGPELAARLHQLLPELPVMWMSAHPVSHLREHGMVDATASVLQKPFGELELSTNLSRALGRGRA